MPGWLSRSRNTMRLIRRWLDRWMPTERGPVELEEPALNVHDFVVSTADGGSKPLGDYAGNMLLIVNVASKCGLTPQYAGLEELQRRFGQSGLQILGFPCNQFGGQEPGTDQEIQDFCSLTFDVSFPVF